MEKLNEEEKLDKNTKILNCVDCNLNLEEKYSYCKVCNKKVCLNCVMNHNNNCKEKKIENELKDIELDIINEKKNSSQIKNYEDKNGRNYGIDLLKIIQLLM